MLGVWPRQVRPVPACAVAVDPAPAGGCGLNARGAEGRPGAPGGHVLRALISRSHGKNAQRPRDGESAEAHRGRQ